jgi:ATP-dependent helicase/nuclease subunit A
MTVHAAKGLEFPIVFVPELSSKLKSDSSQISFDPNRGIGISIPDPDEGYELRPTSVKALIDAEARERQIAERKRLLYVAMTRAKDHLVLSGDPPGDKPREMWMDWIWKSLNLTAGDVAQGFKSLNDNIKLNLTTSVSVPEIGYIERPKITDLDEIARSITPMKKLPEGAIRLVLTPSMIKAYEKNASGFVRHYILGIPEIQMEGFGAFSAEKLGTALHEVLRGIDPEVALSDFGLDTETQLNRMIGARDRFLEIDDIKNARRHLTEIPVRGRVGKETVTGTIDRLVFSDNEGYSILDYKTDTIPKDGEAVVAKEYELQLAIYSNLLKSLLGDPEQSQLYFVSTNCFFGVEKDYPDLVEEIEEVANRIREL